MQPQRLKQLAENGLFLLFLALLLAAIPALGFVGWRTGFALLVGAFLSGLFLIWTATLRVTFPSYRRKHQVIGTALLLVLVVGLGAPSYYHALGEDRADVKDHLDFAAKLPSPDDLSTSVITVINGGRSAIQYRLVCHITQIVANHGRNDIRESFIPDHERSGTLDSGKDAQSDDCLLGMPLPTQILDCADIKVRLFYSLKSQPARAEEKDHGFIARKRGDRFEWEDHGAEQEVSDCAKFVQHRPTLDEQYESRAKEIEAQNKAILSTRALMAAKKNAARLSTEILQFGIDEEPNMPKPVDVEKSGPAGGSKSLQDFLAWGQASSQKFHSMFDSKLVRTFESARKQHIDIKEAEGGCSIISDRMPPTLLQTRLCGVGVGELAAKLSAR